MTSGSWQRRSGSPTRRSPTAPTSHHWTTSKSGARSCAIRATGSSSRATLTACGPRSFAGRNRRRGWVSTPRTYRAANLASRPGAYRRPRTPLPLSGIRVLDMTTFWAGPCCTHFLAMLGAEVIHVESTRRPDGTRLIAGIPITEDQWWEKSPIFAALNTNKKGLTLDLQSTRGSRAAVPAHRDVRRDRGKLHSAGAGPDRPGFRGGPSHQARRNHAADARVRTRRAVARQPRIRLRHRIRRRA